VIPAISDPHDYGVDEETLGRTPQLAPDGGRR
jgi:hypothetical protein